MYFPINSLINSLIRLTLLKCLLFKLLVKFVKICTANADSTNNSSDDDSDSDDDVILVYADEPTPSQAERATKLQFAPTFFIKIDQIQSPGRKLITPLVIKQTFFR